MHIYEYHRPEDHLRLGLRHRRRERRVVTRYAVAGLCARIQTDPAAKMCMLICDWCEECILLTLRTSFKRTPKCVEHISWHA